MKTVVSLVACLALLVAPTSVDATQTKKKVYKLSGTWSQTYLEGWALDRINQSQIKLDGQRLSSAADGTGITVYVIDTGVGSEDCNGHGSFIADIIAGDTYGVATGATIVGVKAMGCDGTGTEDQVISAVNWVYNHADPEASIANMSIVGLASDLIDAAVNRLASKIPVVVAAGNSSANACNMSPARAVGVISVAGFDQYNRRSIFSNYGSCVDIWAPGTAVDGIAKSGIREQKSGTSMSAAIISGAIAVIADRDDASVQEAAQTMMAEASRPYFLDARLNGTAAYAVWIRD